MIVAFGLDVSAWWLSLLLVGLFTTPRTWVALEVIDASIMNVHVRDNLNDLDGRVSRKPFMVWLATSNQPPASDPATPAFRNGHPVLEFVDGSDTFAVFSGVLSPDYDGGGLTVELYWMAETAISNNVAWVVNVESHTPDIDDLDSDSWGPNDNNVDTTASAAGELSVSSHVMTDGASIDNLAAGESFRLRVWRDGNGVNDTMTDTAQLLKVVLRET